MLWLLAHPSWLRYDYTLDSSQEIWSKAGNGSIVPCHVCWQITRIRVQDIPPCMHCWIHSWPASCSWSMVHSRGLWSDVNIENLHFRLAATLKSTGYNNCALSACMRRHHEADHGLSSSLLHSFHQATTLKQTERHIWHDMTQWYRHSLILNDNQLTCKKIVHGNSQTWLIKLLHRVTVPVCKARATSAWPDSAYS